MSASPWQLKADVLTTLGHPARTRGPDMLTGSEPAAAEMFPQVRPDMARSSAVPGVTRVGHMDGVRRRASEVTMRMTRQYLAGELSVLLAALAGGDHYRGVRA